VAKLTVSIAGVDYDRTRAIFDGTIGIDGCETICCPMSPEKAFHRAFRYQEFDCPASTPVRQRRPVEEERVNGSSSPVKERRWDNNPSG